MYYLLLIIYWKSGNLIFVSVCIPLSMYLLVNFVQYTISMYYHLKDINVDVPHGEFESKNFFKRTIVYVYI